MSKSGYTCVRHVFCWLNIFLWITGCGILGVGIWLRISYEGYATLLPQYALLSADSITIVIGVITFVLSFFGCCGSWYQNRCMLISYFSLVVFMFIVEFIIGSLAFVFRERLGHILKEELQNGLWHHYNITAKGSDSLVDIWDNIQSMFHCCGVRDYQDWFMIDAWPNMTWVPDSCCTISPTSKSYLNCGKNSNANIFYNKGCYNQIHMWFVQRLHTVGIIGLFVAFIQLFGLISSMLLFCTIKYKRTSSYIYKAYENN